MATVSEAAWYPIGRVDFCACCGLRRPLGRVNLTLGPDQEQVRCVDCFFGPPDPFDAPVFIGEAIWVGLVANGESVNYGQTGDVLRTERRRWLFEPHGQPGIHVWCDEADLYGLNLYHPEPYSERTPPEE